MTCRVYSRAIIDFAASLWCQEDAFASYLTLMGALTLRSTENINQRKSRYVTSGRYVFTPLENNQS
jgi:hypothetical protein